MSSNSSSAFSPDHRDMIAFILIMSLHGLQSMIAELLPEFSIGGLGVSIGPLWFAAMSVVLLFRPFWGCFAIPVGGTVFGEIPIGDFSTLGAIKSLIVITLSWFSTMSLIMDPKNVKQIAAVGFLAKAMEETAAWFIDVGKFYIGVEELEAISWFPETVWAAEGIGALFQIIIAGVVFGAIPTLFLYSRLRGKIEPPLGMSPVEGRDGPVFTRTSLKRLIAWVALMSVAFAFETLSETSGGLITLTSEFVETYGQAFLFIPIAITTVISFGPVAYRQCKVDNLQD